MISASEVQELVIIETLSADEVTPNRKLNGTIRDVQKNRLTLIANEEIAESVSIRVQSKALLWLGEVVSCAPEPEDMWAVDVRVKRGILIL